MIYEQLHGLLQDQKGGVIFTCLGLWHWLYMLVIFGAIFAIWWFARNQDEKTKHRVANGAISCAFALYMLDFFLMPFAYGEIDIDKLPFHMCTAMCILSFFARRSEFLGKFRTTFALLGLISNLIYVVYPAGIAWHQVHPLSYRAVQTLLFHGAMLAYGIFVLALETKELPWEHCQKELAVIAGITVWALLGNLLYSGNVGDYVHAFNWFFVQQDPFGMLPAQVAQWVMPFAMMLTFFVADLLIYCVYHGLKKVAAQKVRP